jgi:hypothetical protein
MRGTRRLGGWWRLWIVFAGTWVLIVTALGVVAVTGVAPAEETARWASDQGCWPWADDFEDPKVYDLPGALDRSRWKELVQTDAYRALGEDAKERARKLYAVAVITKGFSRATQVQLTSMFLRDSVPGAITLNAIEEKAGIGVPGEHKYELTAPNGQRYKLSVPDGVPDAAIADYGHGRVEVAGRCASVLGRDFEHERWLVLLKYVLATILIALLVPVLILVAGMSVSWVRRGFTGGGETP